MLKRFGAGLLVLLFVALYVTPAFAAPDLPDDPVDAARYGVVRVVTHFKFTLEAHVVDEKTGKLVGTGKYAEYQNFAHGSGIASGRKGDSVSYFITNNHVVTVDEQIGEVITESGGVYYVAVSGNVDHIWIVTDDFFYDPDFSKLNGTPAHVVQTWPSPDIAIIRVNKPLTNRVPLPLYTAETLKLAQPVHAVGFPGASDRAGDAVRIEDKMYPSTLDDISVTTGTVSKVQHTFDGADYLQTDTPINGGNSGGPLVDDNGYVVGINTLTATGAQGIHYAVYIDYVTRYFNDNNIPFYDASEIVSAGTITAGPDLTPAPTDSPVPEPFSIAPYLQYIIIGGVVIIAAIAVIIAATRKKPSAPAAAPISAAPPPAPFGTATGAASVDASMGKTMPAAPAGGPTRITGTDGVFLGNSFTVTDKISIGRDPNRCHVVFPPKTAGVSALHCEIRRVGGALELVDRGSSYGTFLSNGEKLEVNKPYTLRMGDSFYLGETANKFRAE